MDLVRREFYDRPPMLQWLARTTVDHRIMSAIVQRSLGALATVGAGVHLERLTLGALDALYGTEYYRGLADELGGARSFHAFLGAGWDDDR